MTEAHDNERIRAELAQVAMSPGTSGRHALAKTTTLRALVKLNRSLPSLSEAEQRLWAEDRDENERVSDADWHPNPGTEWVRLDSCQTVGKRRRW